MRIFAAGEILPTFFVLHHASRRGFFVLVTRVLSKRQSAKHFAGVRILRARRWELAHVSREQKYSPQAKFFHSFFILLPRQSAWFFRFGDPCFIENAKCKALCGSSHSPLGDRQARLSGVERANIRQRRNSRTHSPSTPKGVVFCF